MHQFRIIVFTTSKIRSIFSYATFVRHCLTLFNTVEEFYDRDAIQENIDINYTCRIINIY